MATWSKEVFAKNLLRYMEGRGLTQRQLAEIVGVSAPTLNEWIKAKKYPRIDKIEILANYFGILKSDLIEDKSEDHRRMQKNNEVIADIVVRLRTDSDYLDVCTLLKGADAEQLVSIKQMLSAFIK